MFSLFLTFCLPLTLIVADNSSAETEIPELDDRIVGGTSTTIENRPYQLSLQYNGGHTCGASIIATDAALTAAHCTDGRSASSLTVRAGSTYRESGGQVIAVKSICQHNRFNSSTVDYDVSVLKLEAPFQMGVGVKTINLQPVGQEVPVGANATASGWGTTSENGALSNDLQEVTVPRINDTTCQQAYGIEAITPRMVCYGYESGSKDSCQGDSGGPLVYDNVQVGVISWGGGCARPENPGVYAKVSEQSLTDHINNCLS